MTMLTLQQTFDKAAIHLLTQNKPALIQTETTGKCLYRLKDGDKMLMCGVGCLIDDDHYNPTWDDLKSVGSVWTTPGIPEALFKSGVDYLVENMDGLLSGLQWIHDNEPPEEWRNELEVLAHQLCLDPIVITSHGTNL